jgi:hypothetical protein
LTPNTKNVPLLNLLRSVRKLTKYMGVRFDSFFQLQ